MTISKGKLIATGIAIAYVIAGRELELTGWGARLAILLVISQLLIWFPEELGSITGMHGSGGRRVDAPTPGCAVSGLGWVFLVAIPLWYWIVVRSQAGH